MKIALTTRGYDKRGGISRYVSELAEHFALDHEVHVYTPYWRDVGNKDVIFHKVPTLPGPLVINSIPFTIQNTLRFKIFGSRYDITHINGGDSLCQDIITAHSIHKAGIEFRKNNKQLKGLGFHDLYAMVTENINYSHRNYRKIICDSNSSKQELMDFYQVPSEDIEVIPVGVNPDEFKPLDRQSLQDLRDKYKIARGDKVLLIVATEFYRKGITELIQAVNILVYKHRFGNLKLLIVGKAQVEGSRKGDAVYRILAKKLGVSKNIVFTGMVKDLNEHYNLADIFVFPTKYEAFGIPTLEAMSCGLPVINSKIGSGELITHGYDGIHFNDPNSVDEIVDKIEMLLTDENMRLKFGTNARKTAMKYSWDKIADRTMEVYKKVLNN
ncbi:MAG: glycosyltransferase family 4 protein [Candidatus Methanoperedens sp.]|nr:glycosyltransferase family 4 protein [Candidatus Methanoperedens sp.]